MGVPTTEYGETLVQDGNYRHGLGGQSTTDESKIVNVQVRGDTKRLLVETVSEANAVVADLTWNEVVVISSGLSLSFISPLRWISFINDDDLDDVYVRLGSFVATTNSTLAWKLKPGESFHFNQEMIPANTTGLILTTLPTKMAIVRVGVGLS